jgi:hypothetical protein
VKVNLQLPADLTEKEKDLFRQLAQLREMWFGIRYSIS